MDAKQPKGKEAFDFLPGSVNVPILLTPFEEREREKEGALVYRYVKGIRWEKGTLTLSLSLSPSGPRKEFEQLEVNSNFLPAPTLLSSSLGK